MYGKKNKQYIIFFFNDFSLYFRILNFLLFNILSNAHTENS